jgi:alpha-ketoglutarate-dependent taurine dioxygenase
MAPPAADIDLITEDGYGTAKSNGTKLREPLKSSGSLDQYEQFDITAVIGREFPKLQLTEILNDDTKLRDLAILVSQRGVVFFRGQDIGIEDQKLLGQKLGELTGKPETSKASRIDTDLQRPRYNAATAPSTRA